MITHLDTSKPTVGAVVTASGDGQLLTAWRALGLNTLNINVDVDRG